MMNNLLNNIPNTLGLQGNGGNGGGIQDLIQSLSITGNIMLDTMIVMNAFSFFKGYVELAAVLIKDYSIMLVNFIFFYIKQMIKSKLTGKIVFRCEIAEGHQMYSSFFKHIIDNDIQGDVKEDWKFKWLKIENDISSGTNYFEQWRYREESYDRPTDLAINYHDPDQKLKFKQSYGMSDKITKIFKFTTDSSSLFKNQRNQNRDENVKSYFETPRTFYVRVTWKKYQYLGGGETKSKVEINMDLILFDMPKIQIPKMVYFQVLYKFLDSRFDFFKTMLYVYEFKASNTGRFYHDIIKNMKWRSIAERWTIYGDDNEDLVDHVIDEYYLKKEDEIKTDAGYANPASMIEIKVSPKDINHNYKEDLVITSCKSDTGYLHKYVQLANAIGALTADSSTAGYFQWKNMVILILSYRMYVAKIGKYVLLEEVQDIVQHIIDKNLRYTEDDKNTKKKSESKKQQYVYKRKDNDWDCHVLSKRTFETIYLPKALKNSIVREFNNFVQMQHLFKQFEIPYRKGVLFYGPPGTGKTSLVKAIAYEYQVPLYILDVNDEEINDDSIVTILNSLGGSGMKILLFEDIDTAFADKERMAKEIKITKVNDGGDALDTFNSNNLNGLSIDNQKSASLSQYINSQIEQATKKQDKKYLTYSGLLNALDGVMSNQTGVITIMTTNYIERLGQAFLRPGRIDCKFELKECDREQIEIMTKYFVRNRIKLAKEVFSMNIDKNGDYSGSKLSEIVSNFSSKLVDNNGNSHLKPCELQSYLLKHIDNIPDVFENVDSIAIASAA